MAYVTGSANTLAELLAAIQNACLANGWTLSGNVLHKGACYAEVSISGTKISVQSGTGVDGANALTGRATSSAGSMVGTMYTKEDVLFTYPCVYDIFINVAPDEVYAHVTFSVNCHQQIGFGLSTMLGLAGTGNWYAGGNNYRGSYGYAGAYHNYPGTEAYINGSSQAIGLFAFQAHGVAAGVDHAIDGPSWSAGWGARDIPALMGRQPNTYNQESILMPVRCYAGRPSGFISPVLECAHLRYVNIANLNDGQVITLGTDRWKVFPYARRGGVSGSPGTGSGNAGHAFRYDGP